MALSLSLYRAPCWRQTVITPGEEGLSSAGLELSYILHGAGDQRRLAEDLTASLPAVPPRVISTLPALRRVSEEPPQLEEAAGVSPTPGTG